VKQSFTAVSLRALPFGLAGTSARLVVHEGQASGRWPCALAAHSCRLVVNRDGLALMKSPKRAVPLRWWVAVEV
jgi:hypothetical protein